MEALSFSEAVDRSKIFFGGMVCAEMKKVTYNVEAVAQQDGDVLDGACECAAEMGPTSTCKHMVSILLVICKLVSVSFLM